MKNIWHDRHVVTNLPHPPNKMYEVVHKFSQDLNFEFCSHKELNVAKKKKN